MFVATQLVLQREIEHPLGSDAAELSWFQVAAQHVKTTLDVVHPATVAAEPEASRSGGG